MKKILIVDDLPINIKILGELLKKRYGILVANNAQKALQIAGEVLPDLILMDVMMPGMDGFTACKVLKSQPETADIPLIFITALNETEDIVKGFEVGGQDYIAKPFNPAEIFVRIQTHLELKSSRERLQQYAQELEEMNHELKTAMEKLRKYRDHLEEMVQERTIELKKANEQLQHEINKRKQKESALRSLAAELSIAEERERRRIAIDIHDYISQSLAVANMKLELLGQVLSSTVLSEKTKEIRISVKEAIKYSRSLTFELSPPVLYELGLEAAVEWLCGQFYERYGIQFTFEDDRQPKPMEDEVRVILFKVVRELLINSVKHAKAKLVNVSLRNCGEKIRVLVKDDGIGFDTSTIDFNKNCGFGFFSIRERLRFLGGNMMIESKPGHGTCITLEAPLKLN